jgi:hypothetical protein
VAADVHFSHGGTKAVRQGMWKPALSAKAASEPTNLDEIAVDNGFTVITAKKRQNKTKIKPTTSETAINTALPPSPTHESHASGSSDQKQNHFLITPRKKIRPVVIHHHFQCDMTRLNKDFHSKFQPIGFTTYRIKAGIACETSTYQDYINFQSFLKENKVPFKVIKGIPPTNPVKPFRMNYLPLGWQFKTPSQ